MNCAGCGAQVPASFGHAIRRNECPACGGALMDEESMALVEELRAFVLHTVKVREETADTLARAMVAAYRISGQDGAVPQQSPGRRAIVGREKKDAAVQVGGGEAENENDSGIVKASDLFDPTNPISPAERDEILQERIETRLIAQAAIPSGVAARVAAPAGTGRVLTDRELAESPVLAAQRLARLQRQEANQASNPSSKCMVVSRRDDA